MAAKNYRSGHNLLRQSGFGYIDLKLHTNFDPSSENCFEAFDQVEQYFKYMESYKGASKFLCSFSHIFAGGYSAGYYSYMWARVLSADCFEAFEEVGLNNKAKISEVGSKFKETILELGGSRHPSDVFKLFRGRSPKADAFIKHNGLVV